MFVYMYIH